MASVTQKIGNFVLGISTQPDERKAAGQVVDLVNGVPDVVNQLTKRPGSSLVKDMEIVKPMLLIQDLILNGLLYIQQMKNNILAKFRIPGLSMFGDAVMVLQYQLIIQVLLEQTKLLT